jgi:F-type H+-transporting ATPase subunit delta
MFRAESWADAFIKSAAVLAVNAEEALEYFKLFCRSALFLPGDLSGHNDADRLGSSINAALKKTGQAADTAAAGPADLARRMVMLLIRKNCFSRYRNIILKIEKGINDQKGITELIVESVTELDGELLKTLQKKAAGMTGAKEVKVKSLLIPELIGGLRIRVGSKLFDASFKTQLHMMAADLSKNGLEA